MTVKSSNLMQSGMKHCLLKKTANVIAVLMATSFNKCIKLQIFPGNRGIADTANKMMDSCWTVTKQALKVCKALEGIWKERIIRDMKKKVKWGRWYKAEIVSSKSFFDTYFSG